MTPLGTAHRLLRLEAELFYTCEGTDDEAWYAERAVVLDQVVKKSRERIAALGSREWKVASEADVVAALGTIDKVLHESGFAVCVKTHLLSQALGTPYPITDDGMEIDGESCIVLRTPSYRDDAIRDHTSGGLRPIDCDLSSFIYLTIAELDEWPMVFVEVPEHNFVRWRFQDGTHLNWDTNEAAVYADDQYRSGTPISSGPFDEATEAANGYLKDRTRDEIDGYYLGVLVSELESSKCVEAAYTRALEREKNPAIVYNNLAWRFATDPAFKGTKFMEEARRLSQRAVDAESTCNYWDTLSCAYAAADDFEKAKDVERVHVSPASPRIAHFEEERDCYEKTVAAAGGCPPEDSQ